MTGIPVQDRYRWERCCSCAIPAKGSKAARVNVGPNRQTNAEVSPITMP